MLRFLAILALILLPVTAMAQISSQDLPPNMPFSKSSEPSPAVETPVPETPPVTQPAATETPMTVDEEDKAPETNLVILQGLNKVTGHISKVEGPLGTVMNFGTLEIIARRCWRSPPDERPENAALLEIREVKAGEQPQQIFLGWMFSSSPGLSGLEHPVYDINILSCEFRADPEAKSDVREEAAHEEKPAKKSKAVSKEKKK